MRVDWGSDNRRYAVPVRIHTIDRVGLLRDIASVLSADDINIV
jgi:(p)ppGpp synthase/HD superfamily hydrolase